jgi:hypothetical protein
VDFVAAVALIPYFHPGAERPECAQVFDSIANGLSSCSETPVFDAITLCALCQKEFSRCALVESHAFALQNSRRATKLVLFGYPLVTLSHTFNTILVLIAFWRQKLSDLISARRAFGTVVH